MHNMWLQLQWLQSAGPMSHGNNTTVTLPYTTLSGMNRCDRSESCA